MVYRGSFFTGSLGEESNLNDKLKGTLLDNIVGTNARRIVRCLWL